MTLCFFRRDRDRVVHIATLAALLLVGAPAIGQTAGPPPGATSAPTANSGAPPAAPAPGEAATPAEPLPADIAAEPEPGDPVPPTEAPAEAAPAPAASPAPVPVAFLGLWAGPDDADTAFSAEERVRTALGSGPFELKSSPSSPVKPSCFDDVACRTEALTSYAGAWVVLGTLASEGTQLQLRLILVQAQDGHQAAAASVVETSNDEGRARLLQSIDPLVSALVQTLDPGAGPAVPADVPVEAEDDVLVADDPVPVPEDETRSRLWPEEEEQREGEEDRRLSAKTPAADDKAPPEASAGINYAAWAWSGGFLGAGALLAVGGIGFDLFSPTSVDDELTALDGVGPGLVFLGAGIALVGLVVNPFLWWDLTGEEADDDAAS